MSEIGTILDQIMAVADAAVSDLSSERGLRVVDHLSDGEFPHLFVHNPERRRERIDFKQFAVVLEVPLLLATTGETQEQLLAKVELIKEALEGDAVLNPEGTDLFVASEEIRENPGDPIKGAEMLVTQTTVDT